MYKTGNGSGTCANIKAAGITIYTIQVNTMATRPRPLLQNCASSSDKFFLVKNASDINRRVQQYRHQSDQAARRQVRTK